ncbi:hypothetical protein BJ944DRAFT_264375 [Cunninghamella echinulata]|nr:hypothetical protein BJ944DRAFT_264375 [Cunninghamella echinulata]
MSERSNPKAYYNQPGYIPNNPRPEKVHKPDEINDDQPPPPYYSATQSSSSSSPSSPSPSNYNSRAPSTYASAQEYPSYGTLGPSRHGLLDPRNSNPYQQQHASPSSSYNIPDVASTYSPSPSPTIRPQNPHLPRDWVPSNNNSNNDHSQPYLISNQQHSSNNHNSNNKNYNFSPQIRIPSAIRQRMDGSSDDDDDDPGCCKKWCKCIFLIILIWIVIFKYNDVLPSIGWSGRGDGNIRFWQCKDQPLVKWEDLPEKIQFEQNLYLAIEGGPVTVSGGSITIYPSNDDRDQGWIESQVWVSDTVINEKKEELYYRLDDQQHDDTTHLILHLPLWSSFSTITPMSNHPCVKVNMVIYLPDRIKSLRINVNNLPIYLKAANTNDGDYELKMDQMELITSNAPIQSDLQQWKGDTLSYKTTNGEIKMTGVMEAKDWISLQSTNAPLTVNSLIAKDKIDIITTNGKLLMQSLAVKNSLHISSTNAPISLESHASSDQVLIQTTNGAINLAHVLADSSLIVTTNNHFIKANVVGDKKASHKFSTTNGQITLYMVIVIINI